MSAIIDDIDKNILHILQKNARTPYSEIAKNLNMAETTVRFRVKRLIKNRVISSFIAVLNPVKIGFSVSGAILIKLDPLYMDSATQYLAKYPEISYIYRSTGEYDAVAVIFAHDMDHFNILVKKIKMIKGVKDIRVSVTTEFIKSDPTFAL